MNPCNHQQGIYRRGRAHYVCANPSCAADVTIDLVLMHDAGVPEKDFPPVIPEPPAHETPEKMDP